MKRKTKFVHNRIDREEQQTGYEIYMAGQPIERCANKLQRLGWMKANADEALLGKG